MQMDELLALRLTRQHLLTPTDTQSAASNLCGIQAQYLSHALHALRIRTGDSHTDGLIKTWTLRGTLHLIPEGDLPLYFSRQGTPEDVCDTAWYRWSAKRGQAAEPARERYFAHLVCEHIVRGCDEREALRRICREAGMTETEEDAIFHSWGGVIAELAQLGLLCFQVCPEKRYRLCPAFEPMPEAQAQLELARRYFTHFGPASLRDAAYFFHAPQRQVRKWLEQLPAERVSCGERDYFLLPGEDAGTTPDCLFLAGFDQLLLGYRKEDNPFLPPEHLRSIFNLAGNVAPAVLLHGRIVGKWKVTGGRAHITLFETVSPEDRRAILQKAEGLWPGGAAMDA